MSKGKISNQAKRQTSPGKTLLTYVQDQVLMLHSFCK